jgi:hypothetical protein
MLIFRYAPCHAADCFSPPRHLADTPLRRCKIIIFRLCHYAADIITTPPLIIDITPPLRHAAIDAAYAITSPPADFRFRRRRRYASLPFLSLDFH